MTGQRQSIVGGALSLILGAALVIWLIPAWVEEDADLRLPVDLLPKLIAYGFCICGGVMLARGLIARGRSSLPRGAGFEPGEFAGFAGMIGLLLLATIGFQFFHFLVVAPVLVAVAMWVFGPVGPISLIATSIAGPLLIWVLTTDVLGRVLP